MLIMIFAVWTYQLLYHAGGKARAVLEPAPVRIGLVLLMIVYLVVVAQPSTKAFIYFDF
jgi:hypothetical protein